MFVVIIYVLRLYFNYAGSTFWYSYVGEYFCCNHACDCFSFNHAVKSFCNTYASESFSIEYVGDSLHCIYAGESLYCNYAGGISAVLTNYASFLENKQNSSPHPLCNKEEIQLWLTNTNFYTYILLQIKPVIIKTFNFKFANVSFTKLTEKEILSWKIQLF